MTEDLNNQENTDWKHYDQDILVAIIFMCIFLGIFIVYISLDSISSGACCFSIILPGILIFVIIYKLRKNMEMKLFNIDYELIIDEIENVLIENSIPYTKLYNKEKKNKFIRNFEIKFIPSFISELSYDEIFDLHDDIKIKIRYREIHWTAVWIGPVNVDTDEYIKEIQFLLDTNLMLDVL